MLDENPTPGNEGASITDRLERFLTPAEELPEPKQAEPKAQADDDADPADDANQIEPENGEPEDDQQPQISTADIAKYFGLEENMLDVDDDGGLQIKTKIDGKEGAAKFADVLKSYQLQGHIDNKARAIADQERAIQARVQQVEQQAAQKLQQLESLANIAGQELNREFQSVDWQTLRATDPAEYSAKLADFQLRQAQLNQVMGAAQQEKAQQEYSRAEQFQQYVAQEAQRLPEMIPEWKDEATAKKESAEIKEWGVKQGISAADLASVSNAAHVSVLRKAMLYDRLQQSKVSVENKVRTAPKLVKAGQPQQASREQQTVQNLRSQVRKSGGKGDSLVEYLLAAGKA